MALKFVNKSKTKLKNFLREFSITNTLSSSPFIIKVFDVVFETEDCYVFAQEYAPGGDLFDIIPPQVGAAAGCWGGGHEGSVSPGCWAKPPTRLALHEGARWGSRCLWSCLEPDMWGPGTSTWGSPAGSGANTKVVQHLKAGALLPSPGCPGTQPFPWVAWVPQIVAWVPHWLGPALGVPGAEGAGGEEEGWRKGSKKWRSPTERDGRH